MPDRSTPLLPIFLVGMLAGTIVTCTMLMKFRVSPHALENISMSYADFITIMLTAVTVVITILGVFIAVLAVWGYSQFEKMTKRATEDQVVKILDSNKLNQKIVDIITNHISAQLRDGEIRTIVTERVDALLLSDADTRAAAAPAADRQYED